MCVYLFISTIIYTIVQFYIYNYIYIYGTIVAGFVFPKKTYWTSQMGVQLPKSGMSLRKKVGKLPEHKKNVLVIWTLNLSGFSKVWTVYSIGIWQHYFFLSQIGAVLQTLECATYVATVCRCHHVRLHAKVAKDNKQRETFMYSTTIYRIYTVYILYINKVVYVMFVRL